MTPSRSTYAAPSFYLSALRLEEMSQVVRQLARRRLQAFTPRALLVTRPRSRLQAGARVGPADDALRRPARHHYLDVAVRLRRPAPDDVLEAGDVAVDEETEHPSLGKVVLIGGAQRQRHRRQLAQTLSQCVGDDLRGIRPGRFDATRERPEHQIDLGVLVGPPA